MATVEDIANDPRDGTEVYADKKGVWGWMLFDWAAQPFHTLLITFIFAPYFASAFVSNETANAWFDTMGLNAFMQVADADEGAGGQALWGLATGLAGLTIAVLAPVLGSIADTTGPRKPWIFVFAILGAIGSASLWFAVPGGENITMIVLAVMLMIIGSEFAAVFNNAMMPGLVPRSELGRLSGNAWGFGYVAGLISLVIVLGFMAASPETGKTLLGFEPIFGLSAETREGDRASGILTGIWFIVFIIPLFLFTPDAPQKVKVAGAIEKGLSRLWQTIKDLPSQKSYFSFLLSSMFYRDGLNALYAFGGIYAANVLSWNIIQLGTFGILANITGAVGAWLGGIVDQKYGPKTAVFLSITGLILASVAVVSTSKTEVLFMSLAADGNQAHLADMMFYVAGGLIGAAGGAVQAASRTLLCDQVPPSRITEAFGLYALSGRATAFIGPFAIAWATIAFGSTRFGVTPVIALFVLGLALLFFVKSEYQQSDDQAWKS